MSRDKNQINNKGNIYPSDYIDFKPNSNRSNRPNSTNSNRMIKLITVIVGIILIILLVMIYLHQPTIVKTDNLQIAIEKVQKKSNNISNKLGKLKELFKTKNHQSFQINEKQIIEIFKIDTNLEDNIKNLQEIKGQIAKQKNAQINKKQLIKIIIIDINDKNNIKNLQEIKRYLLKNLEIDNNNQKTSQLQY